jgi:hypothetical protein
MDATDKSGVRSVGSLDAILAVQRVIRSEGHQDVRETRYLLNYISTDVVNQSLLAYNESLNTLWTHRQ